MLLFWSMKIVVQINLITKCKKGELLPLCVAEDNFASFKLLQDHPTESCSVYAKDWERHSKASCSWLLHQRKYSLLYASGFVDYREQNFIVDSGTKLCCNINADSIYWRSGRKRKLYRNNFLCTNESDTCSGSWFSPWLHSKCES